MSPVQSNFPVQVKGKAINYLSDKRKPGTVWGYKVLRYGMIISYHTQILDGAQTYYTQHKIVSRFPFRVGGGEGI